MHNARELHRLTKLKMTKSFQNQSYVYSTITTFLYFIQACKAAETIVTNTQFILITGLKDYKWTIKKKKKKTNLVLEEFLEELSEELNRKHRK